MSGFPPSTGKELTSQSNVWVENVYETVELGKLPNLLTKVYWNLCSKDPSTIEIHETQNMRYLLEFWNVIPK